MTVTTGDFLLPNPSSPSRSDGRLVGLDGLRAIAAALVFAHHLAPVLAGAGSGRGLDVGVMVFFTLSGYVLYRPFVMGNVRIGSFVVRRIARIWPAYLVAAIGVAVLFEPAFLADPVGLLTMSASPLGVVWTLKLEIVFYMMLPLTAWAMRGMADRGRLAFIAGFAALWLTIGAAAAPTSTGVPTGFVMWAFAPGMIVAELDVSRPALRRRRGQLAVMGLMLIALSIATESAYPDFAGGIGAALLLPWFTNWEPGRWSSTVAAAGGISYSVYLWQLPLVVAMGLWSIPATVAVAVATFVVLERPCIVFGRRLGTMVDERVGQNRGSRRLHGLAMSTERAPVAVETAA